MFNPVAPYRYLLPNLYLSVTDIANPDLFACGSRTWISLEMAAFMRSMTSHPAGPHGRLAQKTVIGPPLLGAGGVDTICTSLDRPLCRLGAIP